MNNSKLALRLAIAKFIYQAGGWHNSVELAMELDKKAQEVERALNLMVEEGEVIELEGKYSYLNTQPDTNPQKSKYINSSLTEQERSEFTLLKNNIHKAFYIIGASLGRIRNLRLYRDEYQTFEEFCKVEFGYTRQYVNYQIKSAEIVEDLKFFPTSHCLMTTNGCQNNHYVLPTAERQVRPLASLPKQERVEIWREAVDRVNGKVPPARVVKQIVEERKQIVSTFLPLSNRYKTNQIVLVVSKAKEHSCIRGCWGQVVSLEENSYTVLTWNAVTNCLRHEDLQDIPNVDTEKALVFMRSLVRLRLAFDEGGFPGDPDLYQLLNHLGTKQQPVLSPFIEQILSTAIAWVKLEPEVF